MRSVVKTKEQFNQLSAQAKDALDTAVRNLEAEGSDLRASPASYNESEIHGSLSLIDLAHKLKVPTEGRTTEEIADSIASLAVHAAQHS
ncbi:MAG: hypothetical protein ABSG92_04235 [Conexivisphaerales archaeon]|jgi:hypothetical protein